MAGPTGIIPEQFFSPSMKKQLIQFLVEQPLPGNTKRELLLGWAMWVGVKIRGVDYMKVENSGIDNV